MRVPNPLWPVCSFSKSFGEDHALVLDDTVKEPVQRSRSVDDQATLQQVGAYGVDWGQPKTYTNQFTNPPWEADPFSIDDRATLQQMNRCGLGRGTATDPYTDTWTETHTGTHGSIPGHMGPYWDTDSYRDTWVHTGTQTHTVTIGPCRDTWVHAG